MCQSRTTYELVKILTREGIGRHGVGGERYKEPTKYKDGTSKTRSTRDTNTSETVSTEED